ncbi:hypothetical protein PAT3040_04902 [Paenibacillus agaridevorans]|uniref:SLH domain-containing protein n=1 Tax=Paenibacillus agaridevorans TaxID=171404 RepID=A0A2R5F2W9_9BACL|nr:S-layer homology domain-containing protein [Paenibacillus agaridevorans]GBG10184.1 hypothetical protein PAT3040_04902 [Paenibacillus agaridevorans]
MAYRGAILIAFVFLLMGAGSVMAAGQPWQKLSGGTFNGQIMPFEAVSTLDGLSITGSGNYDFGGGAAGVLLKKSVDRKKFSMTMRIDKVAGWGKDGVDSWINFNLLHEPRYFSLGNPAAAKGLTVFIRPRSTDSLDIEIYRLSEPKPGDEGDFAPGWKGIGGGTIKAIWNKDITFEIRTDEKAAGDLYINGTKMDSEMEQIEDKWFKNGQAYFSIGAAAGTDTPFAYTLRSVQGAKAMLDTPPPTGKYLDTPGHWAEKSIERAALQGIVFGNTDYTFRPNQSITRAEFAVMLNRALKLPSASAGQPFRDVAAASWYAADISNAYAAGLVQGVDENRFAPNAGISRQQMAAFLVRSYAYKGGDPNEGTMDASALADANQVSAWAQEDVERAVELELMRGRSNGMFAPDGQVLRSEAVQALLNVLDAIEKRGGGGEPSSSPPTVKAPWEMATLKQAPAYERDPARDVGNVQAIWFEGQPYEGRQTKVFAYIGLPEEAKSGKVPAVVLAHGGLGTAFADWVKLWNDRGYAAIAMDLEGNVPPWNAAKGSYDRHEFSGPANQAVWRDLNKPVKDQWTYHAVADIILSHSLLRSMPAVDESRIGLVGISWGGVLTSITSGVDDRFSFAASVYGAGHVSDSPSYFGDTYRSWNKETQQKFDSLWEPAAYLAKASMPMLWLNGDADEHFPLSVFSQSYETVPSDSVLSIHHGMTHGQEQGMSPEELFAFADSIVAGGTPLPKIVRFELNGRQLSIEAASSSIADAELYYTTKAANELKPQWTKVSMDAGADGKTFAAQLPAEAKAHYINLIDKKGLISSTPLQDVKTSGVRISSAVTSVEWQTLEGGILNGARAPFSVTDEDDGIAITGQGNYDFAGHAAGIVRTEAVDLGQFAVDLRLDQVAGWGSEGTDSWINFNLLNQPTYFKLGAPSASKGLTVFVRPYSANRLDIEVYRLSEPQPGDENDWVPGWKGIGGGSLVASWNTPLRFEVRTDALGERTLYANGTPISADLSQIDNSWFVNGDAYFSIGAAASGANTFGYRLLSVDDRPALLRSAFYNWSRLKGGMQNGLWAPFEAEEASEGIVVTGQGNYDFTGHAAGLVLNRKLPSERFAVEVMLSEVPGWGSQGIDSWLSLNWLSSPSFFRLGDPGSVKGLNIFIRPYSEDRLDIEVYRISEPQAGDEQDWVPGWKWIGGGSISANWNDLLRFEYGRNAAGTRFLTVNGQPIAASTGLDQIMDNWFSGGKAYFSIGAATASSNPFQYRLLSINDIGVGIDSLPESTNWLLDPEFAQGAQVYHPAQGGVQVTGVVDFGKDIYGYTPIWNFSQWNSRSDLASIAGVRAGSRYLYSNAYKTVALDDDGTLELSVDAGLEYDEPRDSVSDPWLHLYLEQRIGSPRSLSLNHDLNVRFDTRITEMQSLMNPVDYNPAYHAAMAVVYLILNDSGGSGDFINFGIPIFDSRYTYVPASWHIDSGFHPSGDTHQLIYTLGASSIYNEPTGNGNWQSVDLDLKASILDALTVAKNNGFLTDVAYEELELSAVYIGWEVPGIYKAGMQIKNLSITEV